MKWRWARKKMSSIGTRLITLAAISRVHSVACAPWNVASPSGSVIWSVEVTTISGHRKLFHESRNVSAASVASAGSDSGSTMRHSTLSRLAVDPGRLLVLDRERPEELAQEEDAERGSRVGQDER